MVLSNGFFYERIQLDTINERFNKVPTAKEGDANGRGMIVVLTENGLVKNTTGVSLLFKWEHTRIAGAQGLEDFEPLDLTKGEYIVTYPTEMNHEGYVKAEIRIIDNGKYAGSRNMKIQVEPSVGDDTAIESSNEFRALVSALVEVNGWNDRIDAVEADFIQRANDVEATYPQELVSLTSQLADIVAINPDDFIGTDAQKLQQAITLASTNYNNNIVSVLKLFRVFNITGSTIYFSNTGWTRVGIFIDGTQGGVTKTDGGFMFSGTDPVNQCGDIYFQNCFFSSVNSSGVAVADGEKLIRVFFDGCILRKIDTAIKTTTYLQSISFSKCTVTGGSGNLIDFAGLHDFRFYDCTVEDRTGNIFNQIVSADANNKIFRAFIKDSVIEGITGIVGNFNRIFNLHVDNLYLEGNTTNLLFSTEFEADNLMTNISNCRNYGNNNVPLVKIVGSVGRNLKLENNLSQFGFLVDIDGVTTNTGRLTLRNNSRITDTVNTVAGFQQCSQKLIDLTLGTIKTYVDSDFSESVVDGDVTYQYFMGILRVNAAIAGTFPVGQTVITFLSKIPLSVNGRYNANLQLASAYNYYSSVDNIIIANSNKSPYIMINNRGATQETGTVMFKYVGLEPIFKAFS